MNNLTKIQKQILSERLTFEKGMTIAWKAFDKQLGERYSRADLMPTYKYIIAHERKLLSEMKTESKKLSNVRKIPQ